MPVDSLHPPPQDLTERAEPDALSNIDLREFARTLWGYKWLVLGLTTVVGAGVVLWTMRQPRIYQASCRIQYDPNPARPLGTNVEDVASPAGYWASQEFFATQNQIIQSRTVAERVVRQLGLHHDPSFFNVPAESREGWRSRSVEEAAGVLRGRISVDPVRETRLVVIGVRDQDPARAAVLANAIAESYIEKTLEDRMSSTVNALEWLGTQLDTLRGELDASELALHRFKVDHNVLSVSLEDRQNLVASDIQHFSGALTAARTKRVELQARLVRVRTAAQGDTPEESAAGFSDNPAIVGAREALRAKISERAALSTRYGPNHQSMQQLDVEIEAMRNGLREDLNGVLRAAEADVREVGRIESGMRALLDSAHNDGLELNLREIEYSRLNRERVNNEKLYGVVLERTAQTDLTRMLRTTHASLLDRALPPGSPISPNLTTNTAGGVGAGFALGLSIALLLSQLDRRLKSVADIERAGLTILGILPKIDEGDESHQPVYARRNGRRRKKHPPPGPAPASRDLYVHTHPMSAAAECCRTIRTNLTFMSADEPIETIVVTSPNPQEGKTTVTINIAISLAQSGKRVLLIDTDLRRPRIHRAFGIPSGGGVTSVIVGELSFDDAVIATDVPNLDVIPSGPIPPNPSELFHSQRFAELIESAKARYDRVLFDSPPLNVVTDAAVIAPQVQAALIVIKAEHTTRDALKSVLRQMSDVGANVVGGVLNDIDPKRGSYGGAGNYYYYYRNEGYYAADEDHDDDDEPSPRPRDAAPPPS